MRTMQLQPRPALTDATGPAAGPIASSPAAQGRTAGTARRDAGDERTLAHAFADRLAALQRKAAAGSTEEPSPGDLPPGAVAVAPAATPRSAAPLADPAAEQEGTSAAPALAATPPGAPGPAAAVDSAHAPAAATPATPALQTALSLVRLPGTAAGANTWHFGLGAPELPLQGLTLTGAPGAALQLQLQAAAALRPQDREQALLQLDALRRRLTERGSRVDGVQWSDEPDAPWSRR